MQHLDTYAELQALGRLDLLANQVVEGFITGLHKSPFHGFSVEFAEHRAYNNGEPTRNIDWKLFAKTNRLFLKQYEEETNLRCFFLLDTSSSMNYPPQGIDKLRFSVYAIASLMLLLQKQRDAFGLGYFSEKLDFLSEAKTTSSHQKRLFSELEQILSHNLSSQKTKLSETLHEVAEIIHKRSLVIIFTDGMEQGMNPQDLESLFSAFRHLKHAKHEIILFNISHTETETEFNFENKPHLFIDLETAEEIKLNPTEIRDSYQKHIEQYRTSLLTKCQQYGIDVIDANIADGFNHILKSYLVKRAKIG